MISRVIKGFLVAPLAPCFIAATVAGLQNGSIAAIPIGIIIYAVFAYIFTVIIGIPSYLFVSRLFELTAWRISSIGAFLGVACGMLLQLLLGVDMGLVLDYRAIPTLLYFSMFGLITALVFWFVALAPVPSE